MELRVSRIQAKGLRSAFLFAIGRTEALVDERLVVSFHSYCKAGKLDIVEGR